MQGLKSTNNIWLDNLNVKVVLGLTQIKCLFHWLYETAIIKHTHFINECKCIVVYVCIRTLAVRKARSHRVWSFITKPISLSSVSFFVLTQNYIEDKIRTQRYRELIFLRALNVGKTSACLCHLHLDSDFYCFWNPDSRAANFHFHVAFTTK